MQEEGRRREKGRKGEKRRKKEEKRDLILNGKNFKDEMENYGNEKLWKWKLVSFLLDC